jgi:hypothetical protein
MTKAGLGLSCKREDVVSRLRFTNTTVVASHEGPNGGFTFNYVAGNNVGSISAEQSANDSVWWNHVLARGYEDVTVKIALEETWTRPASETRW